MNSVAVIPKPVNKSWNGDTQKLNSTKTNPVILRNILVILENHRMQKYHKHVSMKRK